MTIKTRIEKLMEEIKPPNLTIVFMNDEYKIDGETITREQAQVIVNQADRVEMLVFSDDRSGGIKGAKNTYLDKQDFYL